MKTKMRHKRGIVKTNDRAERTNSMFSIVGRKRGGPGGFEGKVQLFEKKTNFPRKKKKRRGLTFRKPHQN